MGNPRLLAALGVAAPVAVIACASLEGLQGGTEPADAGPVEPGFDAAPLPVTDANVEAAAKTCPSGEKICQSACVPELDPKTGCRAGCEPCEVPANAAGAICRQDGTCGLKCAGASADCDRARANGCEVDLLDPKNCGADCDTRRECGGALPLCAVVPGGAPTCVASCPQGQTQCGGSCVTLATSLSHCGSCNAPCVGAPNLVATCAAGACTKRCAEGYGDCDGNPANGCEPLVPTWVDGDGDGFGGRQDEPVCPGKVPAGRTTKGGDCDDTNRNVRPGQIEFFASGYTRVNGTISYDYDCNGVEETNSGRGDYQGCRVGYAPEGDPKADNRYCGSVTYIRGSASTSTTVAVPMAPQNVSASGSVTVKNGCYVSIERAVLCR